MNYSISFNDIELRQLEGLLIQPKRDRDGYTVHKIEKSKPDDGWDDWRKKIEKTFDIAQQKKEEFNNKQKETELEKDTKKQSADEKPEKKEQKTSFFYTDPVKWARIRVFDEKGFCCVDFSDHKTLNWFFRDCLWTESTEENSHAQQFIQGMERSLKHWKSTGAITLFDVLFHLHVLDKFTFGERLHFNYFKWDEEHPFDYQLAVTRPDEEHGIEYYAVFSSAPVRRK